MSESTDVVVIGSGAAGLCAALAAAVGGARVTVLEGSPHWGGTTAVSGGQAWVPDNHRMAAFGVADDRADALTYLLGRTAGREPELATAFVDAAPRMARFVEAHSPIEFTPMSTPDSFAEAPGGKPGGRNIEVAPVELGGLGRADDLFWPAAFPMVLTNEEIAGLGLMTGGQLPQGLIEYRMTTGQVTLGQGLIAGLLHGCQAAGVQLRKGQPVSGLRLDGDWVTGVRTPYGELGADAVILACGGFEHDAGLAERLLHGPYLHPVSPPVNRGAAIRLAAQAGAAFAHLGEAWSWPVRQGSTWADGSPRPELVLSERMLPHVIWVNQAGRRFVNESSHNVALAFAEADPVTGLPRNLPAWAIADAHFRARYPFAGAYPGQPLPAHVRQADTLPELADQLGIPAATLTATVTEFNTHAAQGADPAFARGAFAYDRHGGDPGAPHPNLGPLTEPPFLAMPVQAGLVGTKGGPRVDAHARVLRWDDSPITGLYAAGNAMAAAIGPGTVSAGATIGSALTWGWLAGATTSGPHRTPAAPR
ncbi:MULTISPECIES: FAD-dependent oxidoreductase [unclassified Crossiella]|uniref:FAD-dependent oxidoreductase n=1 Tax=unclassified Crossiella TaxID=2620835 RepID=UPI001FFE329F|nr:MULTISPECIES: FAD-dependent oxidoreductase [unclassified Crossiella]MCK2244706.1 FAD-dependent oxidoreductase [Crossiella sp. S99.2]MCK2258307.1 FAD-dependent oxidoreductase [Crossiella sp. S99.1]